jgi:hypothetical protein
MTPAQLEALQKICDAATPGSWQAIGDFFLICRAGECGSFIADFSATIHRSDEEKRANAVFAVAARDAMPQLIAELKRANATLERIRKANRECTDLGDFNTSVALALMEHQE